MTAGLTVVAIVASWRAAEANPSHADELQAADCGAVLLHLLTERIVALSSPAGPSARRRDDARVGLLARELSSMDFFVRADNSR